MSETGIAERAKAVNRLTALKLDGGSYQMLSDICKAVYPHNGAWTFSECENLRYQLAWLMHNLNMGRFDNEMWKQGYDEGYASADDILSREENGVLAEHGFVRLPKDADGEYIHLGDMMENGERVARIVLTDGSWDPSVYTAKKPNQLREYFCHEISHYHASTVEDVLREFAQKMNENMGMYTGEAIDADEWRQADSKTIAEYAAKLQLAGDAE